jgi:antitoxin component YwqK of YwqJK toxin-antitoxin module
MDVTYSNGKLEGPYKIYHDNGQLSKSGTYKNGKLHGEAKEFHPNGKLKKQQTFADDLTEGEVAEYNDDGVLIEKVTYKGGKAHGTAEYYDSDGVLFSTFLFEKNILKTARYFNKAGKEISKSERQHKNIDLVVFSPEGIKRSVTTYNDAAERINNDTYYYSTGKIKETNQYKAGKLQGISTGYYASGTKEYEINYAEDERHGLSTYYYPNGKVKSQGWYDNGNLSDDWTTYNEKGAAATRTTYLNNDITGYQESFIRMENYTRKKCMQTAGCWPFTSTTP